MQFVPMKPDSLVNAYQPRRVEYVLGSCTHNKRARPRLKLRGENPRSLYRLKGRSQWTGRISARRQPEGPATNDSQPYSKKGIESSIGGEDDEDSQKPFGRMSETVSNVTRGDLTKRSWKSFVRSQLCHSSLKKMKDIPLC